MDNPTTSAGPSVSGLNNTSTFDATVQIDDSLSCKTADTAAPTVSWGIMPTELPIFESMPCHSLPPDALPVFSCGPEEISSEVTSSSIPSTGVIVNGDDNVGVSSHDAIGKCEDKIPADSDDVTPDSRPFRVSKKMAATTSKRKDQARYVDAASKTLGGKTAPKQKKSNLKKQGKTAGPKAKCGRVMRRAISASSNNAVLLVEDADLITPISQPSSCYGDESSSESISQVTSANSVDLLLPCSVTANTDVIQLPYSADVPSCSNGGTDSVIMSEPLSKETSDTKVGISACKPHVFQLTKSKDLPMIDSFNIANVSLGSCNAPVEPFADSVELTSRHSGCVNRKNDSSNKRNLRKRKHVVSSSSDDVMTILKESDSGPLKSAEEDDSNPVAIDVSNLISPYNSSKPQDSDVDTASSVSTSTSNFVVSSVTPNFVADPGELGDALSFNLNGAGGGQANSRAPDNVAKISMEPPVCSFAQFGITCDDSGLKSDSDKHPSTSDNDCVYMSSVQCDDIGLCVTVCEHPEDPQQMDTISAVVNLSASASGTAGHCLAGKLEDGNLDYPIRNESQEVNDHHVKMQVQNINGGALGELVPVSISDVENEVVEFGKTAISSDAVASSLKFGSVSGGSAIGNRPICAAVSQQDIVTADKTKEMETTKISDGPEACLESEISPSSTNFNLCGSASLSQSGRTSSKLENGVGTCSSVSATQLPVPDVSSSSVVNPTGDLSSVSIESSCSNILADIPVADETSNVFSEKSPPSVISKLTDTQVADGGSSSVDDAGHDKETFLSNLGSTEASSSNGHNLSAEHEMNDLQIYAIAKGEEELQVEDSKITDNLGSDAIASDVKTTAKCSPRSSGQVRGHFMRCVRRTSATSSRKRGFPKAASKSPKSIRLLHSVGNRRTRSARFGRKNVHVVTAELGRGVVDLGDFSGALKYCSGRRKNSFKNCDSANKQTRNNVSSGPRLLQTFKRRGRGRPSASASSSLQDLNCSRATGMLSLENSGFEDPNSPNFTDDVPLSIVASAFGSVSKNSTESTSEATYWSCPSRFDDSSHTVPNCSDLPDITVPVKPSVLKTPNNSPTHLSSLVASLSPPQHSMESGSSGNNCAMGSSDDVPDAAWIDSERPASCPSIDDLLNHGSGFVLAESVVCTKSPRIRVPRLSHDDIKRYCSKIPAFSLPRPNSSPGCLSPPKKENV